MAATVRWSGLDELRAELRNLPDALAEEAKDIVITAANDAKAGIKYPRRTGNLADSLEADAINVGRFGASARLRNQSAHAHLFEHGTVARQTSIGADRGSMPPGNAFIPVVIRKRREMYDKLKAMLVRHGATVTGNA